MNISARKHHSVLLITIAFAALCVSVGCRPAETPVATPKERKAELNKYVVSRRGLTPDEKKNLQMELDKVNATSLSESQKKEEKSKIFDRYFALAKQPKSVK